MTPSIEGALAGKRVLVTGGTGFVGGRLAERLVVEDGARVRALVRNPGTAYRLARLPVELVRGDVTDRSALEPAVRGCDVVFHCAYGTTGSQRRRAWVNREGTRRLLEAARAAEVCRAVHVSTLMVYGRTPDGDLDETAPRRRFGNAYSDSKLEAERIALTMARAGGLPVTVLQPTAVYGPWGGVWTVAVLEAMRTGRQILVDGGHGLANAVYVDDLVSALLLAAVVPGAVGEAFLVSGEEPLSWRELYGRFERMLGGERRTVEMTAAEAREHYARTRRMRPRLLGESLRAFRQDRQLRDRLMATREMVWLRELASTVLPEASQTRIKGWMSGKGGRPAAPASRELPIHPLTPKMVELLQARTRVRIDKARRLLGYRPAFDFEQGMEITEAWARWANLVPSSRSR